MQLQSQQGDSQDRQDNQRLNHLHADSYPNAGVYLQSSRFITFASIEFINQVNDCLIIPKLLISPKAVSEASNCPVSLTS
jgi:hypothetical protein